MHLLAVDRLASFVSLMHAMYGSYCVQWLHVATCLGLNLALIAVVNTTVICHYAARDASCHVKSKAHVEHVWLRSMLTHLHELSEGDTCSALLQDCIRQINRIWPWRLHCPPHS